MKQREIYRGQLCVLQHMECRGRPFLNGQVVTVSGIKRQPRKKARIDGSGCYQAEHNAPCRYTLREYPGLRVNAANLKAVQSEAIMSVWKEDAYQLSQLQDKQHRISCLPKGRLGFLAEAYTSDPVLLGYVTEDADAVKVLHSFCQEHILDVEIIRDDSKGSWEFSFEMCECIEDGHKIGWLVEITCVKWPAGKTVSLSIRSL